MLHIQLHSLFCSLKHQIPSPMAISTSTDWSFPSNSLGPSTKFSLLPSWKPKSLHFISIPHSIPSSGSPSPSPPPVLEHNSSNVAYPNGRKLNNILLKLLQKPLTQEEGLELYNEAKERSDFVPGKLMLKLLIRYLVRSKRWDSVMSLSNDFKRFHVFPDAQTCSKLVYNCIRARKFRIVEALLQVFESDAELAAVAFDSAMAGYNRLHMFRVTVDLYQGMKSREISPNLGCYCRVMEAYQKLGDTENVVAMFRECESRKIFDGSDSKLLISVYSILCKTLGKSGRAYEALEYFRDMERRGIMGDSSMYSSLICAFARIRDIKVTELLFREAMKKSIVKDPEVFMKLVIMYVEERLVEKTIDVVRAMNGADIKVSDCVFCTIVNGFCKLRGFMAGIMVYKELIMLGCIPGQVTYASIINAYCRAELYAEAEMIFLEMQQKGFDKCVVAYSSIVAMYGKTGRLNDAMKLVAKMKQKGCQPNVWVYNSLMDMHGRVKNLRQVEKVWSEMKRRKVAPDKVSYTTVISAYNKGEEYEKCVEFYQEYRANGGVIDKALAGTMVGVFSKTGRINELVKLLQDMKAEGTQMDQRLYSSALNALMDAGLVTQVKWLQQQQIDSSRVVEENHSEVRRRSFSPHLKRL